MKDSRVERRKQKKLPTSWIIAIVAAILAVAVAVYFFVINNEPADEKQIQTSDDKIEQQAEAPNEQKNEQQEEPVVEQPKQPTVEVDAAGYAVQVDAVTEPTYIDGVLIANKKYPLPKDYNPGEDATALKAYKQMEAAAKKAGFNITAFSGFRSYDYQQTLYENYVNRDGQANADRYSARPGHSEHQTGLAFDIGEVGREDLWLTAEFGETPAGQWLVSNAHKYGFILRYPKGKEEITGFMYESWHFRYLGPELATEVKKSGLTLEEYLNID